MSCTLRVVSGVNEGVSYELEEGQEIKLGRSASNDAILPYDPCVSGKHALIRIENGLPTVCDLASTNGTFVNSERLQHGVYYKVKDFLVIGATIIHVTNDSRPCIHHPLSIDAPGSRGWEKLTIYRTAITNIQKEPYLHSGHILVSLLILWMEELQPVFREMGLKIDPALLKRRIIKHRVFEGKLDWMNRSLSLGARLPKDAAIFITPKVQELLENAKNEPQFNPVKMLRDLLIHDFNLAFPLLGAHRANRRWALAFSQHDPDHAIPSQAPSQDAVSLAERDFGMRRIKGFWDRIERAHALNELLVMTGSRGCGKTTALHLMLKNQGERVMSHAFYDGARTFLDPKSFLFFNAPNKLSPYAWRMAEILGRQEFLVVDHFDELLLAMQHENQDRSHLIRALRSHKGPVLLCAARENMDLVDTHLGAENILDMDVHLKAHLNSFHEAFLKGFERRVKGVLSASAKRFYQEKVANVIPYNFGEIKEFLTLCASRVLAIDPSFSETGESTRALGSLGEGCFRDVYDAWMRETPQSGAAISQDSEVLDQVEQLFHEFAKHMFNVHLRYPDQTRRLNERGRLSRDQKLAAFKSDMVFMFSAFRSGFHTWFQEFWMKLDPEMLKLENSSDSPKKLWADYMERTRNIDADYAEDVYNAVLSKVFLEARRTNMPPDLNK